MSWAARRLGGASPTVVAWQSRARCCGGSSLSPPCGTPLSAQPPPQHAAPWRCSAAALPLLRRSSTGRHAAPAAASASAAALDEEAGVPGPSAEARTVAQQLDPGPPSTSGGHADAAGAPRPPHLSVLLAEVLQFLQPVRLKVYLDCTLGAGGHAAALAAAHPEMHTLVGIDLDPAAHRIAAERLEGALQGRPGFQMHLLRGNYSDLKPLLATVPAVAVAAALGVAAPGPGPGAAAQPLPLPLLGRVDGILMDLGVSSMQLDTADRGFSFLRDGPIDMRMDPSAAMSAEEVLNTWSEADLGRIIRDYGEEKMWKVVARRIVQAREDKAIRTTQQLAAVIGQTKLFRSGGKGGGGGKGAGGGGGGRGPHPATRTFQALRIAVNDELQKLEKALPDAISALSPGGRLAVISFHSLEDRLVKHAFLRAAGRPTPEEEHLTYGEGKYDFLDELEANAVARLVTRKPVEAGEAEVAANPRSRSAKLRVLEKLP